MHYGSELLRQQCTMVHNSQMLGHPIIHFPTSSGVSERASKGISAAERGSVASSVEPMDERVALFLIQCNAKDVARIIFNRK